MHTNTIMNSDFDSGDLHGLFLFFLLLPLAAAQNPNLDTLGGSDEYARFNPSMAIIVVILVAAFFFMAFFSVYLRTCNDTTVDGIQPIAVQTSRRAAAARGLESSVIETFPTFSYSDVVGLKIGLGALECAVCLSEFEGDETLRLIPKCDHVFHPDCIDAWLASHTTCPVCRAELAPETCAEQSADPNLQSDVDPVGDPEARLEPEVITNLSGMLNRNRTRGARSGRARKFPRSHSTGHSSLVVQPGDDTERFTLRLPVEVRRQIMENRALNRATSMVVLPREGSSRRGYRGGAWEGNSMSYRRLESLGQVVKSDRWVFTIAPPFLVRESSINSPKSEDLGTSARRKPSFIARVLSFKVQQAAQEVGTSSGGCLVVDKSELNGSTRPPV